MKARGHMLVPALERLADSFVDDSDPTGLVRDLLDASVELLPVTAAAVMLADRDGELRVHAATDERAYELVDNQIRSGSGPCVRAFHGDMVVSDDLAADRNRWPGFVECACADGFNSTYAFPMQLRTERVGALELFARIPTGLVDDDIVIGHALSQAATIGIQHARVLADKRATTAQLQTALNSRIVIEQAKGILGQQGQIDMDTAFRVLRSHARHTRQRLAEVAAAIVERTMDTEPILALIREKD